MYKNQVISMLLFSKKQIIELIEPGLTEEASSKFQAER